MKVIFLDIDGVLNSEQFWENRTQSFRYTAALNEGKTKDQVRVIANIDPQAVALLNQLVKQTDAEIVVSSTWRSDWNIQYLLRYAGVEKYMYGITPFSKDRHRGTEIKEWLDDHPEVTNYVILDDDNDMLEEQMGNLVQTYWLTGLTIDNVKQAINILNDVGNQS